MYAVTKAFPHKLLMPRIFGCHMLCCWNGKEVLEDRGLGFFRESDLKYLPLMTSSSQQTLAFI